MLIKQARKVKLTLKLNFFKIFHSLGGPDALIRIWVFDSDPDGDDDIIGTFTTSVKELTEQLNKPFKLMDGK